MRNWLDTRPRLPPAGFSFAGEARAVSHLRRWTSAILAVAVVCSIKVGLGDALGPEASFSLLGLGILSAGWVGGAGSAALSTVFLTAVSAFLFFPPYRSFAFASRTTVLQLAMFFVEGLAISAIVAAMERARRLQYETARRIESLQALTAALAVARTAEEVTTILVRDTAAFLGASGSALALPDGEEKLSVTGGHGARGPLVGAVEQFSVNDPLPLARAFLSGQTEWAEDEAAYRVKYPALAATEGEGRGAVVALPLFAAGAFIGAVGYRFTSTRHFSAAERTMIHGYVTQAAQALDRTLAAAREALARKRLEALASVNVALAGASTTEEVARVIVDLGTRAMGADICTLYAVRGRSRAGGQADDGRGDDVYLDLIGHQGVAPEVTEKIGRIDAGSGNATFATLHSGEAVWNETPEGYRERFPDIASIESEAPRARAFWSVPLIGEGRPIGLLGMGFYQARRFDADERSFVRTFIGHCAQALLRAERLDAERAARRAAERAEGSLATTLRSIGDAVIATDLGGTVTFMNPVAERLTGWSGPDARGRPLAEIFRIINEQTRQPVHSPVEKVLETGLVVGLANHTVLLGRPNREIPIDDSGAPIRDEAGQVQGVVLVFRDVTEKKTDEARRHFVADATATLASSLDYQSTLARLAELLVPRFADWSAVDIVDPISDEPRRLAVMHVDPAKVQLAHELARKYPEPADAPGGLGQVLRTGQSQLYPQLTEELLAAGAQDDEHQRLLSDLRLRSAMIVPLVARGRTLGALSLVHAESGRQYSTDDLAFVEDIARRAAVVIDNAQLYASERQARLTADVANRTKDEFLASVSHELRTPLNAILGWARMMVKSPGDEKRRVRALEIIERNAVAMARLIEDLLDVSRIISGKVRLEVETVDLLRIIQVAVDSVRPIIESKELRVRTPRDGSADGLPSTVPLVGDASRLQQVLDNLLSNAVKFTPAGGEIQIAVRRGASTVELEVADTGKGIDADFLPHVFEPFRQADGSITRAHGGLGLGLAISRHLVELHGGKIRAESGGVGRGATFSVELPAARGGGDGSTEAAVRDLTGPVPQLSEPRPAPQLRGLRVLAVDDDADARQLVRAVLEDQGAVVRVAASVPEALRAIADEPPEILLSDIGMPGEDGYALIRRVRSLPMGQGRDVPAAALTAYTRAEDRQQVLQAGYAFHVPKPIEPVRLVQVVEALAATLPGRGGAAG